MSVPEITPPPAVLEVARRLESAGFDTWCVGGAVRDALLGSPHLDWDLATAATPPQVIALFGARRTVPVGVQFGTVGVLDREGRMHEVTAFRSDVTTDGRHATVAFGVSIDEDLARRDLTINAIAYHPLRGELRDPFGGRADLERGIVRAVGDPQERMREDRLRALRALRFAGRLRFSLDPATWQAIVDSAPHLTRLSAERVKQEIEKTLEQVERPAQAFRLWKESGALGVLVPSLASLSPSELDVLDAFPRPRTRGRPYRKVLRLAGLFGGAGSRAAADAMAALRFSRADAGAVATIVDRADRLGAAVEASWQSAGGAAPSDVTIRRWVALTGRLNVATVMRLLEARWSVRRTQVDGSAPSRVHVLGIHRRLLRSAFRDPVELADLAVDGDDLRRGGIPAGPGLGKILHALLARVVEDPSTNTPGTLLAIARELHAAAPGGDPGAAAGTTRTDS